MSCAWLNAAGEESAEYFGTADREANIAVNGDTIFPACSISKFVTAICVMKLREQKMIDIDEPVNGEHDHMGIALQSTRDTIIAAEGTLNNASGILERPRDAHIRC